MRTFLGTSKARPLYRLDAITRSFILWNLDIWEVASEASSLVSFRFVMLVSVIFDDPSDLTTFDPAFRRVLLDISSTDTLTGVEKVTLVTSP